MLDPGLIGSELVIRNWRPGDRYWPAHTAAEKKVKELLSDRHATGPQKKLWPVAVSKGGGMDAGISAWGRLAGAHGEGSLDSGNWSGIVT